MTRKMQFPLSGPEGSTWIMYTRMFTPLLLLLEQLRAVPYRSFRLLWYLIGFAAVWSGMLLLGLSLGIEKRFPFVLLGTLFLTLSSVLRDSLYWGQVSGWILLALSIAVFRRYRGVLSGIASSVVLLLKVGFMPFVFFLRGTRAWTALASILFVLALSAMLVYGPGIYSDWTGSMGLIGRTWNAGLSNNLSFSQAVSSASMLLAPPFDRQRAGEDHDYRLQIAVERRETVRLASCSVNAVLLSSIIAGLVRLRRKRTPLTRDFLMSLSLMASLAFLPFVWLHYGLSALVPVRYLAGQDRKYAACAMTVSMICWGLPLDPSPGPWTAIPGIRALIPLSWTAWMLTAGIPDRGHEAGSRAETAG
ncbi:MAG: hypothetical protein AVO35_10685 [Candidatus Aegiribacteria sp. MLS_C]|nr:MAG: hypothetical protein AVO35_10685 [Candidatus Aegiribacteria sp. MLS_C]